MIAQDLGKGGTGVKLLALMPGQGPFPRTMHLQGTIHLGLLLLPLLLGFASGDHSVVCT